MENVENARNSGSWHARSATDRRRRLRRALRALAPYIPLRDATCVLAHAGARHFARLPPSIAVWQALTAHIRHAHTDYDVLRDEGYDRGAALYFTCEAANDVLDGWGARRRIAVED